MIYMYVLLLKDIYLFTCMISGHGKDKNSIELGKRSAVHRYHVDPMTSQLWVSENGVIAAGAKVCFSN